MTVEATAPNVPGVVRAAGIGFAGPAGETPANELRVGDQVESRGATTQVAASTTTMKTATASLRRPGTERRCLEACRVSRTGTRSAPPASGRGYWPDVPKYWPDVPGYWPDVPGYWPDVPGYWPGRAIGGDAPTRGRAGCIRSGRVGNAGGVGEVGGGTNRGWDSGGYQRPSEAIHHPGEPGAAAPFPNALTPPSAAPILRSCPLVPSMPGNGAGCPRLRCPRRPRLSPAQSVLRRAHTPGDCCLPASCGDSGSARARERPGTHPAPSSRAVR